MLTASLVNSLVVKSGMRFAVPEEATTADLL
jgi:hypothetical protein